MIRKTRVRTAAAAAALATSVAIAVTVTGAARADNSIPQPAADGVPAAASDSAPPGPAAFGARDDAHGASYVVSAGDSYWAIAEDILPDGAANGDVLSLTNELISLNISKLGYDVAAMLHPGDEIEVPSRPAAERPEPAALSAATSSHLVVAGDSYWAIAESALGADAAPADVMAKTERLIELNGARLGYENPQMLHPGDVVYLDDPAATPVAPAETQTPDAPEAAMAPDAADLTEAPAVPVAEKVKEEPKAGNDGQARPDRQPARAQTPDSPPLSELAIIATSQFSAATIGWTHGNAIAE